MATKPENQPETLQRTHTELTPTPLLKDGVAEARLVEIYRLIGQSDARAALGLAEKLVKDFTNSHWRNWLMVIYRPNPGR